MNDDFGQLSRERKQIGQMSSEVEELVDLLEVAQKEIDELKMTNDVLSNELTQSNDDSQMKNTEIVSMRN